MDWSKINHFKPNEFFCKCCGKQAMNEKFILALDKARTIAEGLDKNVKFVITSGYRCLKHNRNVGSKDTSSHVIGLAVDIRTTTSRERFIILQALLLAGFTRIGIAKTFIHVDLDAGKAQSVCWDY
jgi:uncharacterized protein YcbK (DUF882 family)